MKPIHVVIETQQVQVVELATHKGQGQAVTSGTTAQWVKGPFKGVELYVQPLAVFNLHNLAG